MLSLQHIFSSCGRWTSVHSKFVDFPPQVIQASANVSYWIQILQAFLKERQIRRDKSAITNNNCDVRQFFFYRRKCDINLHVSLPRTLARRARKHDKLYRDNSRENWNSNFLHNHELINGLLIQHIVVWKCQQKLNIAGNSTPTRAVGRHHSSLPACPTCVLDFPWKLFWCPWIWTEKRNTTLELTYKVKK